MSALSLPMDHCGHTTAYPVANEGPVNGDVVSEHGVEYSGGSERPIDPFCSLSC